MQHAHHLGTLLVNREGVEIRNIDKGIRAYGMRQRTGVFGKLVRPQEQRVLHPLDPPGVHVSRELAVTKNRETLFQAELKPVAAGDPIPGVVVEVFVGDDRLDALKTHVRGDIGVGEHARGVEHIEALVLHGAHVEIIHRDDVVEIEVVLKAVHLLVPPHRRLERAHGVIAVTEILLLHPDIEIHHPARAGGKDVTHGLQVAGDHGEQIRWFRERVMPHHTVPAVIQVLLADFIAIAEQHRTLGAIRLERDGVNREHIRAIGEVGDLPEPFRLALGAIGALGAVKALQRGIFLGANGHTGAQEEAIGHCGHDQIGVANRVLILSQTLTIQLNPLQ